MSTITVTALPRLMLSDRVTLTVPEGATIAAIVAEALPGLPAGRRDWVRVTIGDQVILPALWHRVRPRPGAPVLVRVVPAGGNTLRSVLMIAVFVAALTLGQLYAVPLAGAIGSSTAVATQLIVGATLFAGYLLVNALVPPAKAEKRTRTYSIDPSRNSIGPNEPFPLVLGETRFAPPYAALPYTQEVGDDVYLIAAFTAGTGPLEISDLRIGETPLSHYAQSAEDVQVEIRHGYSDDAPSSLFSQQVIEDADRPVELSHDVGPVTRVSARDAAELEVVVAFGTGLYRVDKKGRRNSESVSIRIRARLAGASTWGVVTTLVVDRKATAPFRVAHRWAPAERGSYEIELYRETGDRDEDDSVSDIATWTITRSIRPEYPFNWPASRPMSLIVLRLKASKRLQGALEDFSGLFTRIAPDWDAATGTWIDRATRNPASLARYLLQGPQVSWPVPDAQLDLDSLEDWHAHCATKGLTFDAVVTDKRTIRDQLDEICTAGRARGLERPGGWGVVIDRPVDVMTTVLSPRNVTSIRVEREYSEFPDAVRVRFLDREADYQEAERIIPWPGFTGTPEVFEEWRLPGATDAALVWTATRRRMYEILHRPDTYSCQQMVEHLAIQPGDRVGLSHPVLSGDMQAAQVVRATGRLIWIDRSVALTAGTAWGVRIRAADGSSRMAAVADGAADIETDLLRLTAALDPVPDAGDMCLIGPYGAETADLIVTGIVPGDGDLSATITLVAHAPNIDTLTDADIPPPWDGRAGGEITSDTRDPLAPVIASIESGYERSVPDELCILLKPAAADPVPIARYTVQHRLAGATAWVALPDQSSIVILTGYAAGTSVELAARATSVAGRTGPMTAVSAYTMLPASAPGPEVDSLTVARLASGAVRIAWAVENGTGYREQVGVRLRYRAGSAPVGETWGWDDLSPLHSGLLLASPYSSTVPADGPGTYGVRAEDEVGAVGPALIGVYDTGPLAPSAISAIAVDDDVRVAVRLAADLTAAAVRIYRSLQAASVSTETDASGALDAGPSARVVWTDVDPGAGPWRYRARAETADGVLSAPSSEATP